MLKKIVRELEDAEKKAEKMIQEAQKKAEKMIQEEIDGQIETREKLILELNKEGRNLLQVTIDNAHLKAKEIYEKNIKEQKDVKKNTLKKFDEAVEIILKQIVD